MPKQVLTRISVALILGAFFQGCSGDTDGGKAADQNFEGTQFVPTEDTAGSIDLIVGDTEIPVSQIGGFFVRVRDRNGSPVPQVRIACDSEDGVAIIEPTSGFEITDSSGSISGKIGCEAPGSFQFACRLPVGGNKRKFVTIKCTGDIPAGFVGFPGAAGGTLGGGEQTSGDGGPGGTNTDGIRIISITGIELDDQDTDQIDVLQGLCGEDDLSTPGDDRTPEPFTDTRLKIKVVNNTNSLVRFTRLFYSVPNYDGTGRSFESSALAFIGESAIDSAGGESELTSLVFSAMSAPGGSRKSFVNARTGNRTIPETLGFRNVKVTLVGTTAVGQTVETSASVTFSFTNYNKCGG